MATLQEYVSNTLNDSRFTGAPYPEQVQIRQNLYETIRKYDKDFWNLPLDKKAKFKSEFMTKISDNMATRISQDQSLGGREAQRRFLQALQQRDTGESTGNFVDGALDAYENLRYIGLRAAEQLWDAPFMRSIRGVKETMREGFENPNYKDAQMFSSLVNSNYSGTAGAYNLGRGLTKVAGFLGEAALAGTLYGSPASPGILTKWVPLVTAGKTARASFFWGYGIQAVVESGGFVAEDLILDITSDRFKDPEQWNEWVKEIPGDAGRGLAFMILGESVGGLLNTVVKGSLLGIKGINKGQSVKYFKGKSFDDLLEGFSKSITNGDSTTLDTLAKHMDAIDPGSGTKWRQTVRMAEYIKKHSDTLWKDENAAQFVMMDQFGAEFKGNKLVSLGGTKLDVPVTMKSLIDNPAKLRELELKVTNKQLETAVKVFADAKSTVSIDFSIRGFKTKIGLSVDNAVRTFAPRNGKVNKAFVQEYIDLLTKASKQAQINVRLVDDFYSPGRRPGKPGDIFAPKKVEGVEQSLFFTKSLKRQLEAIGITARKAGNVDLSDYIKSINFSRWLPNEIKAIEGVKGIKKVGDEFYDIRFNDNTGFAGTLKEVGDYANIKQYTPEELQSRIVKDFGLTLKKLDNGLWELSDAKTILGSDPDINSLFVKNSQYAPLKPGKIAPDFFIVDDVVTANLKSVRGNVDHALKEINKFESSWNNTKNAKKSIQKTTITGNKVVIDPIDHVIHVKLGDTGLVRTFRNISEAKTFLRQDMKSFKVLVEEYLDPLGLRIRTTPTGGYIVFGDGIGDPRSFKSIQQAREFIGELDEFKKLKDITGLDGPSHRALSDNMMEQMGEWKKARDIKGAKSKASLMKAVSASNLFVRFTNTIRRIVDKVADPKLAKAYAGVEVMDRAVRKQYNDIMNNFRAVTKDLTTLDRSKVGMVLAQEAGGAGSWKATAEKFNIEWTDKLDNAATAVMKGFEEVSFMTGLKPEEALDFYFARLHQVNTNKIRNWDKLSMAERRVVLDPQGLKHKDLDFWAEHLRIEDLHAAKIHLDIDTVFLAYAQVGLRKKFLQKPLRELSEAIKGLDPNLPSTVVHRLNSYQQGVAGRFVNQAQADQFLARVERNVKLANKVGYKAGMLPHELTERIARRAEKRLSLSLTSIGSTLQTSALMSFKLFIPLRNVLQTQYVGAFFDNPQVLKAMADITDGNTAKFWDEAMGKNLLNDRSLVTDKKHFLTFIRDFNRVGTNWLKNSDDWNRIVTMRTVQRAIDQEWGRLSSGKISIKKFMRDTNAVLLDRNQIENFMKNLKQGNLDGMKSIMERHMIYETQFDYSRTQKPPILQSSVGRIAGSYSTYPTQFGEMLARGLKYKGWTFGVRLAANMYATSYLYNDLLGIEGVEGNPLNVLAYAGGPLMTAGADFFSTGIQGIRSVADQPDFISGLDRAGSVAYRATSNVTRVIVPFSWYPRRAAEAIEYLDQGEYLAGMMATMGLNVNEEALVHQLGFDDLDALMGGD